MGLTTKLWGLLDGKKRTIASAYWLVVIPAEAAFPWASLHLQSEPSLLHWCLMTIGLWLSAIGLGHAAFKVIVHDSEK